ncbi:MAG TPA: threonylcarbamoyl-AMP synthase [Gammaproteobacteria bacterium]|nr:threonylcarbamoyl-AMP synthase [Gammaproteobacteria bacterium]
MNHWQLRQAARVIHAGGLIAYPTEAVYGLGCDPLNAAAVLRLLSLKRRSMDKGLILIAADFSQLSPFLLPLNSDDEATLHTTWPGPVTWLLPARPETPRWLRGSHDTLAVRITDHPQAAALCRQLGHPLISTSANRSGQTPARSSLAVRRQLGPALELIISGPLGNQTRPTPIRDLASGRILRPA